MQDNQSSPEDFLRIHEGLMNNSVLATLRRMIYVSALAIVSMLFLGEILDVSDITTSRYPSYSQLSESIC